MKRIAIYSRKSKETDTGESIKNQIQMCKEYFLRKNEDYIFETFTDEGFSGKNTDRPEFQRMIFLAKHKSFDIIACYKIDRIGRNTKEFLTTFDELEQHNVSLVSITEGFDPDTPAGRMMMTMIAGFAEMERMSIAQRVKDNMNSLAKLGRWSGGTPPTGYKSVKLQNGDKTAMYLELLSEFKENIIGIFKAAAEGYSCRYIGKLFNMPPKTILNIINNPTYCKSNLLSKKYLESLGFEVYGELNGLGYLSYNRRPKDKKGKKKFNAKGMLVSVSKHEAPVEAKLWIKANQQIKQRGDEANPRISQYSFLAHKVKCACGSGMYLNPGYLKKNGTRTCYFCCSRKKYDKTLCNNGQINVTHLESDILNILLTASHDKNLLEKYINSKSDNSNILVEIKLLKKEIKQYDKQLDNLSGNLSKLKGSAANKIIESMNSISEEIDKLNEQLLILERENILNSIDNINIDLLQKNIKILFKKWNTLSIDEKQVEINNIIKEIRWDGDKKFKIIFNI
ncbi:resolvase [Clostridium botulinum]|uniref:recombinase family protein n=1 Tax=unclassified Clostridium TaxID=2614128 RepID=UPI0013CA7F3F|nr:MULTISPECIES: recombinase family protein [unclassified Clostridium]MBY7007910.1 recombinase family protein [Clostridium botulinum]NFG31432.1 resolvase [Clostridium botulinum]NFH72697.1 resolvase [Clostridium botulinum]NFI00892.1 resolvase [Clostridium botulinum]NFI62968.1 resolvase [Clostridium botulinum]